MNCDTTSALRVAVMHLISAPWVARIFDGIRRYAQEQGGWHVFYILPSVYGAKISTRRIGILEGWRGDGILFTTNQPEELRFVKKLGIPAVNLASGLEKQYGIPRVTIDSYAAGQMAADHLLERDLTHLAFIGSAKLWYSLQRYEGFRQRAEKAGVECHALFQSQDHKQTQNWEQQVAGPAAWLKSLPLPCGVFAAEDFTAQLLLDACKEAGLRVPQDIAIVGMDNNETICEHSVPKLTSIARHSERIGYEAAALLHSMIRGESCFDRDIIISPEGVILRESSDMMYCSDPLVQQAIEYMRQNIRSNYNIDALADSLGISKRTLERSFVRAVNCPPYQYLTRLRIRHAQTLMKRNPKKSRAELATECGFGSETTFYCAFRKATGIPPSAYRKSPQGII